MCHGVVFRCSSKERNVHMVILKVVCGATVRPSVRWCRTATFLLTTHGKYRGAGDYASLPVVLSLVTDVSENLLLISSRYFRLSLHTLFLVLNSEGTSPAPLTGGRWIATGASYSALGDYVS